MLTRTMTLFGGLGPSAEARLWSRGVLTWRDLAMQAHRFLGARQVRYVHKDLEKVERAWAQRDWRFFVRRLAAAQLVRVFPHVQCDVAYLDVETTGLQTDAKVTSAVLRRGSTSWMFVRGSNFDALREAMDRTKVLFTFNGRRFDVPLLERDLGIRFTGVHVDLCEVLRASGIRGGQKVCENLFRVGRSDQDKLDGRAAPRLWQESREGKRESLELLLKYNHEDVLGLERLAVSAYNHSMAGCPLFRKLRVPDQSQARQQVMNLVRGLAL